MEGLGGVEKAGEVLRRSKNDDLKLEHAQLGQEKMIRTESERMKRLLETSPAVERGVREDLRRRGL